MDTKSANYIKNLPRKWLACACRRSANCQSGLSCGADVVNPSSALWQWRPRNHSRLWNIAPSYAIKVSQALRAFCRRPSWERRQLVVRTQLPRATCQRWRWRTFDRHNICFLLLFSSFFAPFFLSFFFSFFFARFMGNIKIHSEDGSLMVLCRSFVVVFFFSHN